MSHEIWLSDANGTRLTLLESVISFAYARVVNGIGAFSITLPNTFSGGMIQTDGRVEFWRDGRLQTAGLIRKMNYADDAKGLTTLVVGGVDMNDLLRRRIVAYAAGSVQASKSGHADDVLKAIVRENLGASATATRAWTGAGLTVQADVGLAPTMEKGFSWRNVFDVVKEIADSSATAGTPLYFDIVPLVGLASTPFEFRTYITRRGLDHSATSATPVVIGVEFGTLATPSRDEDHADERNYIYAGGQGEGAAREIVEVSDLARIGISPFGRCEDFADARNESTTAGVTEAANAALRDGRPHKTFGGNIVDSLSCRYGIEWDFGDTLTATYLGAQYTAMIKALTIAVDATGKETIAARLEATE